MAIPSNREEFTNYCLRKLGEPVIKVNVAVEQVEDRVEEALYKFWERHSYASEEVFIFHDITSELDSNSDSNTVLDTDQGYIQLPNDIIGVVDVFRPAYSSNLYTVEYQSFMTAIFNTGTMNSSGGLSYYYIAKMNLALLNRFFRPDHQYDFNPITNKLTIAGGLQNAERTDGGVIIRAFKKLHGEELDSDPAGTVVHNIWKNKWLQDYATELIRRQWGENLSKYQSVQLLGGVTMNGEQILQRAEANIEKLETQLKEEYELPPGFIVG